MLGPRICDRCRVPLDDDEELFVCCTCFRRLCWVCAEACFRCGAQFCHNFCPCLCRVGASNGEIIDIAENEVRRYKCENGGVPTPNAPCPHCDIALCDLCESRGVKCDCFVLDEATTTEISSLQCQSLSLSTRGPCDSFGVECDRYLCCAWSQVERISDSWNLSLEFDRGVESPEDVEKCTTSRVGRSSGRAQSSCSVFEVREKLGRPVDASYCAYCWDDFTPTQQIIYCAVCGCTFHVAHYPRHVTDWPCPGGWGPRPRPREEVRIVDFQTTSSCPMFQCSGS